MSLLAENVTPNLLRVRRTPGIAGLVVVHAYPQYPGEDVMHVVFVGSVYGGPVFTRLYALGGDQIRVQNPERFGETLDEDWVRRFYGLTA